MRIPGIKCQRTDHSAELELPGYPSVEKQARQLKKLKQSISQSQPLLRLGSSGLSAAAQLPIADPCGARRQVGVLGSQAITNTADKTRPAAPRFEGRGCAARSGPREGPAHTLQGDIHKFKQPRALDSKCHPPRPRCRDSQQVTFPRGRKGRGWQKQQLLIFFWCIFSLGLSGRASATFSVFNWLISN